MVVSYYYWFIIGVILFIYILGVVFIDWYLFLSWLFVVSDNVNGVVVVGILVVLMYV